LFRDWKKLSVCIKLLPFTPNAKLKDKGEEGPLGASIGKIGRALKLGLEKLDH
jgi:hypothetical protein